MTNIATALAGAAVETPDAEFVVQGDLRYSYQGLAGEARRAASGLASLGVQPGYRVALLLPNHPDFAVAYYGALLRGAVVVPVNATSPAPEVAYFLESSGATVLVASEDRAGVAGEAAEAADGSRHVVGVAELIGSEAPEAQAAARSAGDTAVILYTSGTTGRPRGAQLTHGNLGFVAELLTDRLWRLGGSDTLLMVAPASHMFGQAMLNVACRARARLAILAGFDPEGFFKAVRDEQVTFIAGVPTLGQLLLHAARARPEDLGSLRTLMLGGSAMPDGMADALRSTLGVEVLTGYGLTEAVPISHVTAEDADVPPDATGRVVEQTEVRIVDEDGRDVDPGEPGEILARGPQVMQGYLGDAEGSFVDGWFRTGDVGRFDDRGYLYIVDRLKDMIKASGYSVFPTEVEGVLTSHPEVTGAAVVGVPHEVRGEEVRAYVEVVPEAAVTPEDLRELCRAELAPYKCPRAVIVVDRLPRNPTGKVLRRQVLESLG